MINSELVFLMDPLVQLAEFILIAGVNCENGCYLALPYTYTNPTKTCLLDQQSLIAIAKGSLDLVETKDFALEEAAAMVHWQEDP